MYFDLQFIETRVPEIGTTISTATTTTTTTTVPQSRDALRIIVNEPLKEELIDTDTAPLPQIK